MKSTLETLPIVDSLRHRIRISLRESIISGKLKPGQRIVETEIARTMGISQVPVREALRGLEEEGLVRSVTYKGAYVSPIVPEEMYHTFLLRTQVEKNALAIIVPNLSDENYSVLDNIVKQMHCIPPDCEYAQQTQFDIGFHSQLIAWSNVEVYMRTWQMLYAHVQRFITLIHPSYFSDHRNAVIQQHEQLLAILRTKNVQLAQDHMHNHIMMIWNERGLDWLRDFNFTQEQ
ncbi:MAG: GntR family transcriptional regulator [Bacilli bacterium]